ncbi:MAG: 3-oxoacid CoA-transferase subunit A [Rhodospirillales bacterium]|nr:3-oxoacid CoA-transferase subunit A [Rhodospirillales bacterium]
MTPGSTIDKRVSSIADAVKGIKDSDVVLTSGFGEAGNPTELIHALIELGAKSLTIVNNNAGTGDLGLAALLKAGRVKKIICSYPRSAYSHVFQELHRDGKIELEVIPQGTLAERLRAGGAGIGGFYTTVSAGTTLADGKEVRRIDGRDYVLEFPIQADVALVKAETADPWGNLTYRMATRNFAPQMCMAAKLTIVQARRVVGLGDIDPEHVITPGIFVDRVVEIPDPLSEAEIQRRQTEAGR